MNKKIISIVFMVMIPIGLIGCTKDSNQYSPEEVIDNAMEDEASEEDYYAESESVIYENDEVIEEMNMKEWRTADGKVRVEVENKDGTENAVTVNNRESLVTYEEERNQAMIVNDPEVLEVDQPTPKEQAEMLLDMVGDTHEITMEDEEEIAGRTAYHITAEEEEEQTLYGNQEIWVDKENWMVLKVITKVGDNQSETTYTKVDLDPNITDDLFELDLPDDAEIIDMDEVSEADELTLEEAREEMDQPFIYFPEEDELEIDRIELIDMGEEFDRTEVNIEYQKDGSPLMSMSVFETPEEINEEEDLSVPGEESVSIRDQEGNYIGVEDLKIIDWEEDGLTYSIILTDPELTIEEVQEMAEQMEEVE